FPLSHTRPATMTTIPFKTSKSKPNLAASGGQRTNQRRRASRRKMTSPYARLPGSPRTGNETHFQAHSALEINIDFRLTFGLENAARQAWRPGRQCGRFKPWKFHVESSLPRLPLRFCLRPQHADRV